ncbi:histidine phosphatase superfamily [Roridomyces roridus]|uniref:Histidine phosphatase superfamily n=1 Tax=Roridomyces roridus TaxID=1738132 RepID=A0AAD7BYS1_9AGAR|nr:histidine phosphatase superfamily [Roridomyces roridus]
MTEPAVRVYVVRHGETRENREEIIQGQMDTDLNDVGLRQVGRVADALRSTVHFDAAYSSDLKRAFQTGEMILAHREDIQIRAEQDLRERCFGDLEGQKRGADFKAALALSTTAESADAFSARAVGWWKKAILQRTLGMPAQAEAYNVLVTSHGAFIATLLHGLVGSGKVKCGPGVEIGRVPNTSVTIVEVERDGLGTVVQFGDYGHLTRKMEGEMVDNVDQVGSV